MFLDFRRENKILHFIIKIRNIKANVNVEKSITELLFY